MSYNRLLQIITSLINKDYQKFNNMSRKKQESYLKSQNFLAPASLESLNRGLRQIAQFLCREQAYLFPTEKLQRGRKSEEVPNHSIYKS